MVHAYNIIIDQVTGSIGHSRDIVDGLNAMGKKNLSILMINVQLISDADHRIHMAMHI